MKFYDFINKIEREGYSGIEQYCNVNCLNYDDLFGPVINGDKGFDDDCGAYSDDDDDDDGWTGFEGLFD